MIIKVGNVIGFDAVVDAKEEEEQFGTETRPSLAVGAAFGQESSAAKALVWVERVSRWCAQRTPYRATDAPIRETEREKERERPVVGAAPTDVSRSILLGMKISSTSNSIGIHPMLISI